jgi:hypothetical protein
LYTIPGILSLMLFAVLLTRIESDFASALVKELAGVRRHRLKLRHATPWASDDGLLDHSNASLKARA